MRATTTTISSMWLVESVRIVWRGMGSMGGSELFGLKHLRFDHPNVGYVIDGQEDATVRYGLERDFDVGERVKFLTPAGNVFGYAKIEEVWTGPVRLAYYDITLVDGRNHPAEDTNDLWNRLQKHYPDEDIDYDDTVTVIYFDLFQVGGG